MNESENGQVPHGVPEGQGSRQGISRRDFLRIGGVGSATAAALAACQMAPQQTAATQAPVAPATAPLPATAPPPATAPTSVPAAAVPAVPESDLLPYPRVKLGTLGDLSRGALTAAYPDDHSPVQILKLGTRVANGAGPDGDIVAYSGLCTHMGCPVTYDTRTGAFQCPCHFSQFDVARDAMLVNGPATQHLPRVALEIDGQDIYAVGIQGLIYGRPHNLSLTE